MTTWTKPRIGVPKSSRDLDYLCTSPDTRPEAIAFTKAFRPPATAPHLLDSLNNLSRGLEMLSVLPEVPKGEVTAALRNLKLSVARLKAAPHESTEPYFDLAAIKAAAPAYAALTRIRADDDHSLMGLALAYLVARERSQLIRKNFALSLIRETRPTAGPEGIGEGRSWGPGYRKLLLDLKSLAGEQLPDVFQEAVCKHFVLHAKLKHHLDSTSHSHHRTLTSNALEDCFSIVARGIQDGNPQLAVIGAGWLSGLPFDLSLRIPLHQPAELQDLDSWVIWLDTSNGWLWVNLSPIVRDSASINGNENYIEATKMVARPLPQNLHEVLQHLHAQTPSAEKLGDLADMSGIFSKTSLVQGEVATCSTSVARFFRSRAVAGRVANLNSWMTALVTGSLDQILHSRLYYLSASEHSVEEATASLYERMGWGTPVSMPVGRPEWIGSFVSPYDSVISKIAAELGCHVESLRPARRWTLQSVIQFHNSFARYVCFLLSLSVLSRARGWFDQHGLLDAVTTGILVTSDKTKRKGAQFAVAVCKVAQDQIKFWFIHLQVLRARLIKSKQPCGSLLRRIDAALLDRSGTSIFEVDESLCPLDVGTTQVYRGLSPGLRIKADAARHFGERIFNQRGVTDRTSEAQAKRSGYATSTPSAASTFSYSDVRREIEQVQSSTFADLGISALRGLQK